MLVRRQNQLQRVGVQQQARELRKVARTRALGGEGHPLGGDRARRVVPRHVRARRDQFIAVVEDRLNVALLGEKLEPVGIIGVRLLQELDRLGTLRRQLHQRILFQTLARRIPETLPVGLGDDVRHEPLLERVSGHLAEAAQRAADDLGRILLHHRLHFLGLLVPQHEDMIGGRQLQRFRRIAQRHLVRAFLFEINRHAAVEIVRTLHDAEAPRLVEAHQAGLEHEQEFQAAETFGDRHRRLEARETREPLHVANRRERALRQLHPERAFFRRARPPGGAAAYALDGERHGGALDQSFEQQLGPRIGLVQMALRGLRVEEIKKYRRDVRYFCQLTEEPSFLLRRIGWDGVLCCHFFVPECDKRRL